MDALPHKPQPRLFHAILVMVLLLCLAIGTLSVWRTLVQNETHRQQELLQQEVEGLARQMETRFDYQTDAIQRMARRWSDYRRHPPAWQRDADALLEDFDNIQAIEWLDASHCIRWIHPLQGNEPAVEFQYPDDHPNLPYLQIARESGQPVLSNQFELVQGGAGLAYQIPLYRDAGGNPQFDGYLIAIFRAEALLHSLLAELPTAHLSLTLEDRRGTLFQRLRADTHYSLPPAQARVHLGDSDNFTLYSYPNAATLHNSPIPTITLISGLLASALLCHALWLALLATRRLEALQLTNRTLQSEIAHRHQVEQVLQSSQSRLQLVLDMTDYSYDALFILNLDPFEIVYMNRTCWASLGYSAEQLRNLLGICPDDVVPGAQDWLETLREQSRKGESAIYQRHARTRTGKLVPLEISVRPMKRLGIDYLVCVGRNNHQQLEATAQLERLTQIDGLTGLFNRRSFDAALAAEWRRLQRQQLPLGMLMVDVDHFKLYNDTYGHLAGDDALRSVSRALQQHVGREGDRVCRYGGEEFAILLPGADIAQCRKVADLIHAEVRQMKIPHVVEPERRLSISIGIACALPGCEHPPESLVQAADQALYEAKKAGRNRSACAELVS